MFLTGIESETLSFPPTISEDELLTELNKLNSDDRIDGIIVQLPVPEHISERKVCNAVHPSKGLSRLNLHNLRSRAGEREGGLCSAKCYRPD